jgi:hypothetical protein
MATKKKSSSKKTTKKKEAPAEVAEQVIAKEVVEAVEEPKSRKKILWVLVAGVLLIAIAAGTGILYQAYLNQKERADRLTNPTEAAKEETRLLIEKVSSLTELPNEEPTIATVRDVSKLQSQTFFKNAQNGDKVLIFTQSKKAVLYRPSTEKIIEIAPVNLGDSVGAGTETQTPAPTPVEPDKPQ